MSSQSIPLNTGAQAIIQTESREVFLWNKRTQDGQINNATYSDLVLAEGTVLGRVSGTGLLKVFQSGSSDGSQFPIGVLVDGVTIPAGLTYNVAMCDDGDVNANGLIFQGGDTLQTVVSSQRVIDRLKLAGIKVIASRDLTGYDNA